MIQYLFTVLHLYDGIFFFWGATKEPDTVFLILALPYYFKVLRIMWLQLDSNPQPLKS